ncbi:MAG: tetratricopeptide repeat protein, partial [Opitutales bacterium]|nr:tetratricopeptide repeat protein [Opitutales bacterium]
MNFRKKTLFIFLFFCAQIFPCLGSEKWTPALTFDEIVIKAKKGSGYHMGLLGIFLRSGEAGCSVNLEAAKQWSYAALKKGHPFGSYNLANLAMLRGDFTEATKQYQDAALLLERQASDGDPAAMYCMGEINFQVIPTDVRRALDLFQKSADAGYPQAQATIGALYLKGLPGLLERDPKKGVALLFEAVKSKSLTARFNLGMAYYNGDGVKKDGTKASQWLQVAERQNFAEAQYFLGILYAEGSDGVTQDTEKAAKLLMKSAEQNHKLAREYLAKMEVEEKSSPLRIPKTLNQSSLSRSNEDVLREARKYYTGIGRTKNYNTAFS